jgi:hypothetical protein
MLKLMSSLCQGHSLLQMQAPAAALAQITALVSLM